MWRIRWAPNNTIKWQMWFNSAFEGLMYSVYILLALIAQISNKLPEVLAKDLSTLWGHNVGLLNVKLAVHIVTTGL